LSKRKKDRLLTQKISLRGGERKGKKRKAIIDKAAKEKKGYVQSQEGHARLSKREKGSSRCLLRGEEGGRYFRPDLGKRCSHEKGKKTLRLSSKREKEKKPIEAARTRREVGVKSEKTASSSRGGKKRGESPSPREGAHWAKKKGVYQGKGKKKKEEGRKPDSRFSPHLEESMRENF